MARVLIAEDDDSIRNFLIRALERAGHSVEAVGNGLDALPHVASREFDLLLSDIVMPEMDGLTLANRTARLSPQTRVVFITGFAAVALANGEAEAAGAERVLAKPFHLKDVVSAVNEICPA